MSSKTLGIALATICGLGCALGATACDKGGEGGRKASDRLKWVQSPKAGSEAEGPQSLQDRGGLALMRHRDRSPRNVELKPLDLFQRLDGEANQPLLRGAVHPRHSKRGFV